MREKKEHMLNEMSEDREQEYGGSLPMLGKKKSTRKDDNRADGKGFLGMKSGFFSK